jgi:formamidopyrimidine-DNA glycosylase
MPELPEVEITARLIGESAKGLAIESALTPGINALKTFDPPVSALEGRTIAGVRRRGKLFIVDIGDDLTILIHLMSAGRLQLFDKRASLRDKASRMLIRLDDGRELRLREFGTKQRAWLKLLRPEGLVAEETLAELGPDAWPDPPEFGPLLAQPRPLYALLRDQHVIAGIGRSWVDEILHGAKLSPFKRGVDLSADEAAHLREVMVARLGEVIDFY